MVFGLVLESFGLSLYAPGSPGGEVNDAWVDSRRDCFMTSLLGGDALSRVVMRWTVYPTPLLRLMAHNRPLRGQGLPIRCRLVLSW
jgi:hypothetical protein